MHCQSHVDQPETLPLQCEPLVFRRAIVTPGFCPFCLGDSRLPAPDRLHQFLYRNRWQQHLINHIKVLVEAKCPHLLCTRPISSTPILLNHLQDVHRIELPKTGKRSWALFHDGGSQGSGSTCSHRPNFGDGTPKSRFVNYTPETITASNGVAKDKAATGNTKRRKTVKDQDNPQYQRAVGVSSSSESGDARDSEDDWDNNDGHCHLESSSVTSNTSGFASHGNYPTEEKIIEKTDKAEPTVPLEDASKNKPLIISRVKRPIMDQDLIPTGWKLAVIIPSRSKNGTSPLNGGQRGKGKPKGRPRKLL